MNLGFGILQLRRPSTSPLALLPRLPLLTPFLVCFVPPTFQGRARMAP